MPNQFDWIRLSQNSTEAVRAKLADLQSRQQTWKVAKQVARLVSELHKRKQS